LKFCRDPLAWRTKLFAYEFINKGAAQDYFLFPKKNCFEQRFTPSTLGQWSSLAYISTIDSYSMDFKSELTHLMFLKHLNNRQLIAKRINGTEIILSKELTPKDFTVLIDFSNEIWFGLCGMGQLL
jgi:hypothetical protein